MLSASCCIPAALHATEPALDALPIESVTNFDPGNAVNVTRDVTNAVLDIKQDVDKAVLNWQSFDVGGNATVNFNQLSSSSLTLNRINQLSASQIFGQLNANGRIFLINQNGILFGEGSQINVHELTASTLNITDQVFEDGILSAIKNQQAAFSLFEDASGNPLPSQTIIIEQGAELNAKPGGRIFIFAPDIENNGIIRTPDGQTILAAGEKVYLQASDDASLRGILVEVNSGGEATNLGEIIAERGNVTMAGLTVNQNNRISATTSISANGSIRLLARDTDIAEPFQQGSNTISTNNTGTVSLGENSVTQILAELDSDDKAVNDQIQFNSRVEIMGEKIHLKENSKIIARGGEVDIIAVEDPSGTIPASSNAPIERRDNVVVQIEAGSLIDVSGNDATLEMSRNNIEVELRGNELKDLPLQRNGALRGETVVVDVRKADDFQIGDISGNIAGIERTVAERTSAGGSVKINSEGDIRFLEGAEIDVSGGVISYNEGEVQTTLLSAGAVQVDIHNADPNQIYDGVHSIVSNFETAYVEGKDAGTVQLAGHGLIADGTLTGNTTVGQFQRTESSRPQGGKLIIGLSDGQGITDFRAPNITLQDMGLTDTIGNFNIGIDQTFSDVGLAAFEDNVLLSTSFLKTGGFTQAELNSNGNITLSNGDALLLQPDSQLKFNGQSVNINRSISSAAGDLEFVSRNVNTQVNISGKPKGLFISDNVTLDVSGNWTNDLSTVTGTFFPTSPIMLNGGSITLRAEEIGTQISTGDTVGILSLGGARRDQQGGFEFGKGGDVTLTLAEQDIALNIGKDNLVFGYGGDVGGKLSINANGISIEDMTPDGWFAGQSVVAGGVTKLADFIFSDTGFSEFDITSNQGNITIQGDAKIDLITSNLFLPDSAFTTQSTSILELLTQNSADVFPFRESTLAFGEDFSAGFAPQYARQAQKLNIAVTNSPGTQRRNLVLSEGAEINTDPGAELDFTNLTGGSIDIDGTITAPAADINFILARKKDQPFDDGHAIVMGDKAVIDVSATAISIPDPLALGLNQGRVFDAGNVSYTSSGYIVAEQGSLIDASGLATQFDVVGGVSSRVFSRNKTIAADAGSITYRAAEGIVDDGTLNLAAAGSGGAYGGSLRYQIDQILRGEVEQGVVFPSNNPEFIITQGNAIAITDNMQNSVSDPTKTISELYITTGEIDRSLNGKVQISADKITASGTDQVSVKTEIGKIQFQGDIDLSIKRDIVLDAPIISSDGATVNLTSNYIGIGSSLRSSRLATDPLASGGAGIVNVNANLIDLIGLTTAQGIGQLNLNSNGDIRFRGVSNQISGEFAMIGDIRLDADQIYPTTLTDFLLDAGDTGTITVLSGDTTKQAPLSAGGKLALRASDILQQGVIRAPLGQINLQAKNSLVLDDGSLTSVSANGQSILLGQTLNGTEWLYAATGGLLNANILYSADEQNAPEKQIGLEGNDINIAEGATVDLTGGGDVVSWEFIPGPGGSQDRLLAENAGNLFAVIPALSDEYAPFDAQEFDGWDLDIGESVYLAGGNGLAAGNYIKLPARYALLPGAFLVEQVNGYNNIPLGQQSVLTNGTLVAGFHNIHGTDIQDSTTSGFIIRPGDYSLELSEFDVNNVDDVVKSIAADNDFALPRLTGDAGSLSIAGKTNIDLSGELLTAAAAGARGALVDISADILNVVDTKTGALGVVELTQNDLNNLGAESLLLGGNRNFNTDGTQVNVEAQTLSIESGVDLQASEIILVATDEVSLKANSSLTASGDIADSNETLLIDGDSALVRASAASLANINRSNTTGTSSLKLAASSMISSDKSVTLDSSGDVQLDTELDIASGGSLALGAEDISIGDVSVGSGLILDDAKLVDIAGLNLRLRSNNAIKFFGTSELNQADLEFVTSGLIADQTTPADVTFNVDQLVFGNEFAIAAPTIINNPNGALTFNANELVLKQGDFAIEGFSAVTGNITNNINSAGTAELMVNAKLELITTSLTASSGTTTDIISTGDLLINTSGSSTTKPDNGIGAKFNIQGRSVTLNTEIDAPVGQVDIAATDGDVVLGDQANIDVSGFTIDVIGVDQISLSGGDVKLVSELGNVELQTGSRVDVGTGGVGSPAGTLELIAEQGDVSIKGELLGQFPVNPDGQSSLEQGGRFKIDAMSVGQSSNLASQHSFKDLNLMLNGGGFTGERNLRLRDGDINIELGDIMLAQQIKLVAENGSINVAGSLLTSDDEQGGTIDLIAANDLNLNAGAFLSVAPLSTGTPVADAEGGEIYLQATDGMLDLNFGSVLDLGTNGHAHLRASRTVTNDDVMIEDLNAFLLSGDNVMIEANKVFDSITTINDTVINSIKADTDSFMANTTAIKTRLGINSDARYGLQAGIEVQNDGDITVASDWDLSSWRHDDGPGVLTIRSTGDLNVDANINDGVEITEGQTCSPFGCTGNGTFEEKILSDASWSFNLTAGASRINSNFSADLTRVTRANASDLNLKSDTVIRTGTGDIVINAANNVVLENEGSVVYTLGKQNGLDLDNRKLAQLSRDPEKLVPVDGGDLSIFAGNDIIGPGTESDSTQLFAEWYKRQDYVDGISFGTFVLSVDEDAGTYLDFQNFKQGVAALGGGNVNIQAGNDIQRLSVSAPTYIVGNYDTRDVSRYDDGNIRVDAGGDIEGGLFFIGDGQATINAGGEIVSGRNTGTASNPQVLDTVFAQMGGNINVNATGNIDIEAIYNPTMIIDKVSASKFEPIFNTYSETSSAMFNSLSGNIQLDPGFTDIQQNTSKDFESSNSTPFSILPGNLQLAALQGDVNLKGGSLGLFPVNEGSLKIYAGNNVNVDSSITMSDAALGLIPTLNTPVFNSVDLSRIVNNRQFSEPPLHQNDSSPSWVVAKEGDIDGGIYFIPEQSRFSAGRDILDIRLNGQNLSAGDITRVQAGRDIKLSFNNNVIGLSGPGRLEVIAGRNIDLGPSVGIETRGNLLNGVLADQGADILVQAGVGEGPQYLDFYSAYFNETSEYRDVLISFLNEKFNNSSDVNAFLAKTSEAQWNEIEEQFIPTLVETYFTELASVTDDNIAVSEGFKAIDILFPESKFIREEAYDPDTLSLKLPSESKEEYFNRLAGLSDYEGDLSLFFSKIYSLDGGDIDFLVPGGIVNAGLASAPANAPDKDAGELGVVAQSFGDIRTYSRGDFQVNQSRVSTLLGGGLIMWTSTGDIDAGNGAKTAISAPEPRITITDAGDIEVDFSNTVSGSGIRAISIDPNVEPGDVSLLAPNGSIIAGDAGIVIEGDLDFVGIIPPTDNFFAGGVSVGESTDSSVSTPTVAGGDVAAAASQVAEDAAQDQESAFPLREAIPEEEPQLTFISVEVLGYGEEGDEA